MIFATVGNDHHQFKRFSNAVGSIASAFPAQTVLYQHGYTCDGLPSAPNIVLSKFISRGEFDKNLRDCDLLFTHGGAGTLLQAAELKKAVIAMGRRGDLNEHLNNHQFDTIIAFEELDFCRALKAQDQVVEVFTESLASTRKKGDTTTHETNKLIQAIASSIRDA